jgi:hypothetical protein
VTAIDPLMVSKTHIDKLVALACLGPIDATGRSCGDTWQLWWRAPAAHRDCSHRRQRKRCQHHEPRQADISRADDLGAMLTDEICRAREPRTSPRQATRSVSAPSARPAYRFPVTTAPPTHLEGILAIGRYEWGARDGQTWPQSEARNFCEAVHVALATSWPSELSLTGWDLWEDP